MKKNPSDHPGFLKFNGFDALIALAVAVLAVCSVPGLSLTGRHDDAAKTAAVTVDGKEVREIPLDRDAIVSVTPSLTLQVKDGAVRVADSNCPHHVCVHQGSIRHAGETIVCLPNRVVVEITSGAGALDAVVY